jgi:hypothetical protein
MNDRRNRKLAALVLVFATTALVSPRIARSQELALHEASPATGSSATPDSSSAIIVPTTRNVIIVGFVGGFVSANDTKHPEVQFAAYLRDRYPSIHAEVFGNHHGQKALHDVERLLDTNHDGVLSPLEKNQTTVIVYGQSWGATETVAFARQLGQIGVPVALTIQIDTIGKPLHKTAAISPNVATAINFYQPRGFLHGQPEIVAADPAHTKILGNIRMTYEDRPINCDNYSWYSRTFNKPHHEIENDLRLWNELASLINTDLPGTPSNVHAPSPSASPFFQYLRRGIQANGTQTAVLEVQKDAEANSKSSQTATPSPNH